MIKWYSNLLIKKPLTTKCVTSFITFGLGDVICQQLEKNSQPKQFDIIRVLKQASFGVIVTPYLHLQFNVIIPRFFGGSIVKTLLYDQTVGATLFAVMFFTYLDTMNGVGLKESLNNTYIKMPATLIANWKLWPMAQLINFTVVPPHYRVFFANMVGIIWNTYLSYMQNVISKELLSKKI